MEPVKIQLSNAKFTCDECKNENAIANEPKLGDVLECEFCGIEYRVMNVNEDGSSSLELLEEEK